MSNIFPTFSRWFRSPRPWRTTFPTFRRWLRSAWPWRTTSAQRQSLLRLIAVAVEENLALRPLLEAWAEDERGIQRRRLRTLAQMLKTGTPLPDAVEAIPGVLSDEDVLAIRFGAQSGTLAATVRQTLENMPSPAVSRPSRFRSAFDYFVAVVLIGSVIVTFIQIKIAPKLNLIIRDYRMQPPVIVQWSWTIFDTLGSYWYLVALALFAFLWLTFSPRPGRLLRRTFLGRLLFPLRELRAADVLQQLGLATAAGRPITGALSTLARFHFDPTVRHKLLFVRNEVEQGADVWQSMATAGLVTQPEVRVLQSAEQIGNRPWALHQLAMGKKRRTSRRLDRLSEFVLPVLVIALGAFVLFQALAIFVPITQFISHNL
jgi:type II secretory pathway component PulF